MVVRNINLDIRGLVMKNYLYPLKDGKMLVLEDDFIKVEETGYPYKVCELDVGRVFNGHREVIKAVIGYEPENELQFINYCMALDDDIALKDFKNSVCSENIGDNCPDLLQRYAKYQIQGYSELVALFLCLFPEDFIKEDFDTPDEESLKQFEGLLRLGRTSKYINSYIFRQPMLTFMNISNLEDFVSLIKLAFETIIKDKYKQKLRYCSAVKASNGRGCIILCKDNTYNHELQFLYSKLASLKIADVNINIEIDGDDLCMSFVCIDESLISYYASKPTFRGTLKRYDLCSM